MIQKLLLQLLHRGLGTENYLYGKALLQVRRFRSSHREATLRVFFSEVCKPQGHGTFVDVGANIGVTAVAAARWYAWSVHAIEPLHVNCRVMRRVLRHFNLQDRVNVHQCAVTDNEGSLRMQIPVHHGVVQSALGTVLTAELPSDPHAQVEDVPGRTLDSLLHNTVVAAMKIDVENYELQALRGARQLLSTHHPPLIVELWNNDVRSQCVDYLRELGYTAYVLQNGKLAVADSSDPTLLDFVFIADSKQAATR